MSSTKFRKKPVVVEARGPLSNTNVLDIMHWCGGREWDTDPAELKIRTNEGIMTVSEGDWVIRGVKGEFYPCKPEIFELTYEPVDGEAT